MYNKINKLVIVLCVKDACELCSNDIVIFLFISSHVPVVKLMSSLAKQACKRALFVVLWYTTHMLHAALILT